ncbi:hypothetical protein [Rhizobium tubonense]|uniref:hypothetical protein n=1 Tax=Rhizobium tubonense TaxID=484088 RepID=UPI003084687E
MLGNAEFLLASVFPFKRPVRLLGISLSSLKHGRKRARTAASSRALIGQSAKRKSLPREEVRQAFRKEPNNGWEEECRCSDRRPLGGGVGRLKSKLCGRRCIASMSTRISILAAH